MNPHTTATRAIAVWNTPSVVRPSMAGSSSVLGLGVRLHLPQELVNAARYFGEQVGGVGVAERVGRIDRRARRRAELRERAGERPHVLALRADVRRVLGQARCLGDDSCGAERGAAELDGTLGKVV